MKCKYRNCKENVSGGRSDKEYCTVQCKRNEKKYRQRIKKRIENGKETITK